MNKQTILLRQVHPNFIQNDEISSQVFRPTPKDQCMLSMYDGDLISSEDAYNHFISNPEFSSIGVMGVSCEECTTQLIPIIEDRQPFREHISLDFSNMTRNEIEKKAKILKAKAQLRGWLYKQDE